MPGEFGMSASFTSPIIEKVTCMSMGSCDQGLRTLTVVTHGA